MKTITKLGLAVILFMANATTNHAQAQTKEETISWLKEKLEQHVTSMTESKVKQVNIINVSPCEISYKVINEDDSYSTYQFNPSNTTSWRMSLGSMDWRNGKFIEYVSSSSDNKIVKVYVSEKNETNYYRGIDIEQKDSPDIGSRLAKAINHLATFCEKKKEAF